MTIRAFMNIVEGRMSVEDLAERARLQKVIDDARSAFHEDRTRENLKAFHAGVNALAAFDEAQKALVAKIDTVPSANANAYAGEHEAPMHDSGSPLHDLTGTYPADFYTGLSRQYCDGSSGDSQCVAIMLSSHNRPNMALKVYRAIPLDAPRKINTGDWVTISRRYAVEHGRDNLQNSYLLVSKTVFARDLFTDGNSVQEWGYDPQPRVRRPPVPSSSTPTSDGA